MDNGADDHFDKTDDAFVDGASAASAASTSVAPAPATSAKPVRTYSDMFPSLPPPSQPVVTPTWRPAIKAAPAAAAGAKPSAGKAAASAVPKVSLEFTARMVLPAREIVPTALANRADTLKYIMGQTNTAIDSQLTRDGNLNVLIQGRQEDVLTAKQRVSQRLLKQTEVKVTVPKEYHRFLIGQGGKIRQEMSAKTNARIMIPKTDDESTEILVSGDAAAVQAARFEIFNIVSERTNITTETLVIDKMYHVFLQNTDSLHQLQETSAVKIRFGTEKNPNEIVVNGKRLEVADAVAAIQELYAEKKRTTKSLSLNVNKKLHRFVIGHKGANIQEILKSTGCAIVVPPAEDADDAITILGEDAMLIKALNMVMEKANSVSVDEIPISNPFYQRFLASAGRDRLRDFGKDTKLQINFTGTAIETQGPAEEVKVVRPQLLEYVKTLKALTFEEIDVPVELRKYVIGKEGRNIKKLKAEFDVDVIVPHTQNEDGTVIDGAAEKVLLAGPKDKVPLAKDKVLATVKEMADFVTETLKIDQKYHAMIIGPKGVTIKKISEKHESVSIKLTDNTDVVTVRGPKLDVQAVCKEITALVEEAKHFDVMNSFTEEIMVEQRYLKYIIGREGAVINQLRTAHGVRIDIEDPAGGKAAAPAAAEGAAADKKADKKKGAAPAAAAPAAAGPAASKEGMEKQKVTIRGTKKGAADAKKDLLARLQEVIEGGGYVSEDVRIDPKYHGSVIGQKGQLVTSLMDRLNVNVKFPSADSGSDVVVIKGLQKAVDKAKAEIKELLDYEMSRNYSEDVAVPPTITVDLFTREARKTLALMKIAQAHDVRAEPLPDKAPGVRFSGPKDKVAEAVTALKALVHQLTNRATEELPVDRKHFPRLIGRKGARVQEIMERHNQVNIRFQEDRNVVVLQGDAKDVAGAKAELLADIESEDNLAQVTFTMPKKEQGVVRELLRSLYASHKVRVTSSKEGENPDTLVLSGTPEDCQKVVEVLQANPAAVDQVDVPPSMRGRLLASGSVRELSQKHFVNFKFPPQGSNDPVTVSGGRASVEAAKEELLALVGERAASGEAGGQRVREELQIPGSLHGAIIGKRGATIQNIMSKSGARIDLPKGGDRVVVSGTQQQVDEATVLIKAIVDQQGQTQPSTKITVSPRYFGAIIGKGGKNLRELQDEFSVSITVPNASSKSDQIEIRGNPDDCAAAAEEIKQIVEQEREQYDNDDDDGPAAPRPTKPTPPPAHKPQRQELDEAFFAPPPSSAPVRLAADGVWGSGRSFA